MRRVLGIVLRTLLLGLGLLLLAAGTVASVLIGPDDTAQTGGHSLSTPGAAVATEPEALHYVGPVLHLRVESSGPEPIFVGIAHEADAASYLDGRRRAVVERVRLPWSPTVESVGSSTSPLPDPAEQRWWLTSTDDAAEEELVWPIPHGRYVIMAVRADGGAGVDVEVTLGLELDGAFNAALAVTALGLALILLGVWLLLRHRRIRRTASTEAGDSAAVSEQAPGGTEVSA